MIRMTCAAVVICLTGTTFGREDVASGPSVGDVMKELKTFAVTGPYENKDVNYAAERRDKPTVYCFVHSDKFSRPIARFLKALDKDIKKEVTEAATVAVWVNADPDHAKEYLPKVQQSLQLESTAFTYYSGEKPGPKGWNINDMAHVTVVVVKQGKVAAVHAFQSVNETDVAKVLKDLTKGAKKP